MPKSIFYDSLYDRCGGFITTFDMVNCRKVCLKKCTAFPFSPWIFAVPIFSDLAVINIKKGTQNGKHRTKSRIYHTDTHTHTLILKEGETLTVKSTKNHTICFLLFFVYDFCHLLCVYRLCPPATTFITLRESFNEFFFGCDNVNQPKKNKAVPLGHTKVA